MNRDSGDHVISVARYAAAHPWDVFIERWNSKAAVLSAVFRGAAFGVALLHFSDSGMLRSVFIEIAFRIAIGGFWGSLLQTFRSARPRWLATIFVTVALPAASHIVEFAALSFGGAGHVKSSLAVSIAITVGSLLINFALMRKGLLITGDNSAPLISDLQRIPRALSEIFCEPFRRNAT